jgi:hypothetical protein
VAPEPIVDTIYLVLQTGSQSTVRKYNATSFTRQFVETRYNYTEIPFNGTIQSEITGTYNVTITELIYKVERFQSNQVRLLFITSKFSSVVPLV